MIKCEKIIQEEYEREKIKNVHKLKKYC